MSPDRNEKPSAPASPDAPAGVNGLKAVPTLDAVFDVPPTDVTSIPDVAAFVARVRTHRIDPVEMNRSITRGYAQFARVFQALLDPDFVQPGRLPRSARRPNWFAFAPHASDEVGRGIISASFACRTLDLLEGEAPGVDMGQALASIGMSAASKGAALRLGMAARLAGIPQEAATVLGALATAGNYRAFEDPRTLVITAARLAELFIQAPARDPLRRAECIVETLRNTLTEGNLGIYSDVGGAAQAYLLFRRAAGEPSPQDVLGRFTLPGSTATAPGWPTTSPSSTWMTASCRWTSTACCRR